MEFLIFLFVLGLVLAILVSGLIVLGIWPLTDAVNWLLREVGLARTSPETRALGQEHVGRVTRRFRLDPEAGVATGTVRVQGEIWAAECPPSLADVLAVGSRVRVVYEEGLRVRVLGKAVGPRSDRAEERGG
jgi:membrane-bound ClpP family serine protease